MRDHLLDLVEHTYDLGVIDLVKITGTDKVDAICIPTKGRWHDFCFISSSFPMDVGFPAVLPCINQLIFATNLS